MVHLTLNSGKSRRNSRHVLPPQLGKMVRSFLDKSGGSFPFPYKAYRIETDVSDTGVAFYFFSGDVNISVCTGTWSAEYAQEYWAQIEKEYYDLTDVCPKVSWAKHTPKMPNSVPWLASLILPGFFFKVKSHSPDVEFLNTCEFVFFEVAHELASS